MRAAERPLAGVRVLVTRPAAQADGLVRRVRDAGGEPVAVPTLEILPLDPGRDEMEALAQADTVIFVSANAVKHARFLLDSGHLAGRRLVAIGRATKAALEDAGCAGVGDPGEAATSEALLALPALREVAGRRICIVRGRGGREMLKRELESRGARVAYLECYRRRAPEHPDADALARALGSGGTLVVTSTSTAGLSNLLDMVPPEYRNELLSRPLAVIGARQAAAAASAGWLGPVLEAGAGDDHIVEVIVGWLGKHR